MSWAFKAQEGGGLSPNSMIGFEAIWTQVSIYFLLCIVHWPKWPTLEGWKWMTGFWNGTAWFFAGQEAVDAMRRYEAAKAQNDAAAIARAEFELQQMSFCLTLR